MDKLKEMFKIQAEHDSIWTNSENIRDDRDKRLEFVKRRCLDIIDQTIKLLNSFKWKSHNDSLNEDVFNIKEQIIDIQKYTIGFASVLFNMKEDEYFDLFVRKSLVLDKRWKQMKEPLKESDKVAVIDIDGVIMDYDSAYYDFLVNQGLEAKSNVDRTEFSFHKIFNMTKTEDEKYYNQFISTGGFLKVKAFDYAKFLLNYLIYHGIKIVLVTARPNWIYSRIMSDTIKSLYQSGLEYDYIFFDKDKADIVINYIYPAQVLFALEDRDKHAAELSHLGVRTLLLNKTYNQNLDCKGNLIRIHSINELIERIQKIIG